MTTEKFNEAKLEEAIIQLLEAQGYPYTCGTDLDREHGDVLIRADLRDFLTRRYADDQITNGEIDSIIRQLDALNSADLYDSNKTVCKWVAEGFLLKREDRNQKDLYIQLIGYGMSPFAPRKMRSEGSPEGDALLTRSERRLSSNAMLAAEGRAAYSASDPNIYRIVNQLEIEGREKRIPDLILYINGLPLVVFVLKNALCRFESQLSSPIFVELERELVLISTATESGTLSFSRSRCRRENLLEGFFLRSRF